MKPFLKSVAEYTYKNYKEDLHSLVLVFPNKRARLFFNKYLSEIAEKPVFAPGYFTISEYMQKLSGEQVADQLTLLFILYDVYADITETDESFDDFLFYCEMLLSDFDDLDKYLVDARLLFSNLADLKDINNYFQYLEEAQLEAIQQFWKTFSESKPSEEKKKFGNLWNVLFKIYTEFNKVLDEKGLSYEGKAFRSAIKLLDTTTGYIPENQVFFIGFNALNACERKLFSYLKKLNKAQFFWDYDDYYIQKKEYHEAAFFLGDLLKEFQPPVEFAFDSSLTNPEREIKIFEIPTITGQAKAIPTILKELPENWKQEPEKTAITLADESLLMPVLNSLPANIDEVNISMGYPLKHTLSYSVVGILLDLHLNKKIKENGEELFYHKDVLKIVENGLLNPNVNESGKELTKDIITKNRIYLTIDNLIGINPLFDNIFTKGILVGDFIPYLISIFQSLSEIQVTTNFRQLESEASARIVAPLTRLNDILAGTTIKYNFRSLVRLIGKFLQGTSVPFSGEPLSGIQIMGILETRTLDFENLVILSMNEDIFPKSGHVPSFIPYSLRFAHKMPTIEHQDSIYAYYFYRLLHRTKNVILVYSSTGNDRKMAEPSRFVKQIMIENAFNTTLENIVYKVFPIDIKKIEVQKNNEIIKLLREKYCQPDGKVLSPNAINTYLNCPLKFYYRFIAEIEEPQNVFEKVEARLLGNILHKAIESLYAPLVGKQFGSKDLKTILNNTPLIQKAVEEAFWIAFFMEEKPFPGTVKLTGKNILIGKVIRTYIENVIQYDIEKMDKVPFEIKGLERYQYMTLDIGNSLKVKLGGIIDRIDTDQNSIRIIDYKTGTNKNSFKSLDTLFDTEQEKRSDAIFQILVYSQICSELNPGKQISAELYYVRDMKKGDYSGKPEMGERKNKSELSYYKDIEEQFSNKLVNILTSIFSEEGSFTQTSFRKNCSYCPYNKICAR